VRRLLVLLALLCVPAQAHAATTPVQGAEQAANAFWDGMLADPCPEGVAVNFSDSMDPQVIGESLFDTTNYCQIRLNATYPWDDNLLLCKVVTHEIGHVREWLVKGIWGQHTQGRGIMSAFLEDTTSTPQCDKFVTNQERIQNGRSAQSSRRTARKRSVLLDFC
jgi:hypothetical protein